MHRAVIQKELFSLVKQVFEIGGRGNKAVIKQIFRLGKL